MKTIFVLISAAVFLSVSARAQERKVGEVKPASVTLSLPKAQPANEPSKTQNDPQPPAPVKAEPKAEKRSVNIKPKPAALPAEKRKTEAVPQKQ